MISWRTSSVPKEDIVFPRLLYCDSRCSQSCHRRSQVLPGLLSALPVTLKAGRNALPWSDILLKLTHLSLHSTSCQTLLEASSDCNTFCGCILISLNPWFVPIASGIFPCSRSVTYASAKRSARNGWPWTRGLSANKHNCSGRFCVSSTSSFIVFNLSSLLSERSPGLLVKASAFLFHFPGLWTIV